MHPTCGPSPSFYPSYNRLLGLVFIGCSSSNTREIPSPMSGQTGMWLHEVVLYQRCLMLVSPQSHRLQVYVGDKNTETAEKPLVLPLAHKVHYKWLTSLTSPPNLELSYHFHHDPHACNGDAASLESKAPHMLGVPGADAT
eukprot:506468-Amphidinium_carterae.2